MGKRSQRRSMQPKKNYVGCMGGLISIFDFQNGRSTQKLLSDNRHGASHAEASGHSRSKTENPAADSDERCQGSADNEARTAVTTGAADKPPSVKKLIQQELFRELDPNNQICDSEVESKQPSSDHGGHERKNKKRNKKPLKKSRDVHSHDFSAAENVGSEELKGYLNVNAIIDELCNQIHENESTGANVSVSEEKLSEAAEVFIAQKFFSGKNSHDKEFVDAVKMFNSNKELLLKLLQDPNSLLVKHVQCLLESHKAEEDENPKSEEKVSSTLEVGVHKQHRFFRKRNKSSEKNPQLGPPTAQDSSKIVILKPGPSSLQNSEMETGLASPFSLTEIKRMFKRAVGKDWHGNSSDSCKLKDSKKEIGGSELLGVNSPTREHFFKERFPKSSIPAKNRDKISKQKECLESGTSGCPEKKASNINMEAKKHIAEMLSNGDGNLGASDRADSEALGRILSLVDYTLSPVSRQRDSGEVVHNNEVETTSCSVGNQMCSEVHVEIVEATNPVQEESNDFDANSEPISPRISGIVQNEEVGSRSLNRNISDESIHDNGVTLGSVGNEICSEVDVEIEEMISPVIHKEINVLDATSEPSSSCILRNEQIDDIAQTCDEESSCTSLNLELTEENQHSSSPSSSPLSSFTGKEIEHLDNITDRPERPSPVSVLDAVFADDETSTMVELPIQPLEIQFEEQESYSENQGHHDVKTRMVDKETIFEYVKAVLQASDLNWYNIFMGSLSSDRLLEPSLFQETDLFPNQHCHNQKLLFDCINEVLVEVFEHYFACVPWLSFVKPNVRPVPNAQNVINEVWERVNWHLLPVESPCTMDQILRKDMAKSGMWMDLRPDAESIGIEMGEAIIEELIEDTVWSCVIGRSENLFHAVLSS